MVNKQNFTPDEWAKILESMMLAGMAVSAAEPSGLWGTVKEAFASKSAIVASKHSASNELVKAAIAELETREGRSTVQAALRKLVAGAEPSEIVQRALDNLREVSAILEAKAPAMQLLSRTFCAALARGWQKPPWKVACSVLGVRE